MNFLEREKRRYKLKRAILNQFRSRNYLDRLLTREQLGTNPTRNNWFESLAGKYF